MPPGSPALPHLRPAKRPSLKSSPGEESGKAPAHRTRGTLRRSGQRAAMPAGPPPAPPFFARPAKRPSLKNSPGEEPGKAPAHRVRREVAVCAAGINPASGAFCSWFWACFYWRYPCPIGCGWPCSGWRSSSSASSYGGSGKAPKKALPNRPGYAIMCFVHAGDDSLGPVRRHAVNFVRAGRQQQ